MADSTIANEGGEQLAAATKPPRKPRAPKDKSSPPSSEATTPAHPEVTEDIQAPYKFTADEVAHMNVQLRGLLDGIEELDNQKKASVKDFALRIQNKQNEAKMLRNKLNAGEETRPLKAFVEFDTLRSMKRFLHPHSREFLREESMTPADWQLPMFKPDTTGQEAVAPRGDVDVPTRGAVAPKPPVKKEGDPAESAGTTSVGAKITQAAAQTEAARIKLDLTRDDYTHASLLKEFKAAAKAAGWNQAQVSVIGEQLKIADSIDGMFDILRPHTEPPAKPAELDPLG
jgi:hypothetical protein